MEPTELQLLAIHKILNMSPEELERALHWLDENS